uniref:Putative secreted protein n=1 Tax=Rhipicephalus microplus TaxID=6941 RepID=A0A6M2DBU0_RHIMP
MLPSGRHYGIIRISIALFRQVLYGCLISGRHFWYNFDCEHYSTHEQNISSSHSTVMATFCHRHVKKLSLLTAGFLLHFKIMIN